MRFPLRMSISVDIFPFRVAEIMPLSHNERVTSNTPEGWDVPRAAPRLQR